jgi:PPP family 3-phenylpropionic acid transporter
MSRPAPKSPAARLSGFYAAAFLVTGVQLPFWPIWLASRGLDAGEIGALFAAAIWVKVAVTPALGALADRSGRRRAVMAALATAAVGGYAALWPALGTWPLLALNVLALTAQSALMPIGDALTLAAARAGGLDYGRIRMWGSATFIAASLAGGAILGASSAAAALPLVLGASSLLLIACIAMPMPSPDNTRRARGGGWRAAAGDAKFWLFAAVASALQASHQVYYGFGTLHWRSLGISEIAIGWLWAGGVAAEIVLFWQGSRLLRRFGPLGLMALGGAAGVLRWTLAGIVTSLPAIAVLQLLHALTFGASHLGAMHFLSRALPARAAASGQSLYAAISAALGSGVVMLLAGLLYARFGGQAYLFMAPLSAAGLVGLIPLRRALAR